MAFIQSATFGKKIEWCTCELISNTLNSIAKIALKDVFSHHSRN